MFAREGFSDWSAPAAFYASYHCLLAILVARGFSSRNQMCTIAAVRMLIDEGLAFPSSLLDEIGSSAESMLETREAYQYGVRTEFEDESFGALLNTAQRILEHTARILE